MLMMEGPLLYHEKQAHTAIVAPMHYLLVYLWPLGWSVSKVL